MNSWTSVSGRVAFAGLALGICLGTSALWAQPVSAQKPHPVSPVNITFLHLNDVYEYNTVDDGRKGSFPRLSTLKRRCLERNPNTLFFLAGDTISPSVASSLFRGRQMIEMWNALGLDYATFGNHEFDFGPDVLKQRIGESKFRWVASNVRDPQGRPFPGSVSSEIRELSGVKVGIFGLLTPDTKENSSPGPEVVFGDPVLAAQKEVAQLRQQGAQVVVAVTHQTMEEDKRLAREVDVDVILGGHEHQVMQSMVGKTPILKWGSDARILGKVDFVYSPQSQKITEWDWSGISVGRSVASDPKITQLVQKFDSQLSSTLDQKISEALIDLEGRNSRCRRQETNLGNLVADAFREYYKADVAIMTGSAIRVDRAIPKGPIKRRTALMILPYENPLLKIEMTGKQLRAALEHSLSALTSKSSPFPQVSGLRLRFSPSAPVGSRVLSCAVQGVPLADERKYTVAVSNFVYRGGAGFSMFSRCPILVDADDCPSELAVLVEYFSKHPRVEPKVEGRIEQVR